MKRTAFTLCLATYLLPAFAGEPYWDALRKAEQATAHCLPGSFKALFALADGTTGADSSEALSEANENAFLKCPIDFLIALKQEPESRRERIVNLNFGVMHEDWELGAILARLLNHPEVGPLVKAHFMDYVNAKAPHEK